MTTNGYLIYTNREQYMIHDKHSYILYSKSATQRSEPENSSDRLQFTFISHKIKQHLKPSEAMPSIVNKQSLVYQFKCNLCDTGYVGYTRPPLLENI